MKYRPIIEQTIQAHIAAYKTSKRGFKKKSYWGLEIISLFTHQIWRINSKSLNG